MLTCVTEIGADEVDMIEGKGKELWGSTAVIGARDSTPEGILLAVAVSTPCATKRCRKLG